MTTKKKIGSSKKTSKKTGVKRKTNGKKAISKKAVKRAPKKLSTGDRKTAIRAWRKGAKEINNNDVNYALKGTKAKLKRVPDYKFYEMFVRQVELLYKVLRDSVKGKYKLPWKIIAGIAAALIYFISPIDVIPDFIPVLGYLDDAYVVYYVVTTFIRMELIDYCVDKGLDPEYYGLT